MQFLVLCIVEVSFVTKTLTSLDSLLWNYQWNWDNFKLLLSNTFFYFISKLEIFLEKKTECYFQIYDSQYVSLDQCSLRIWRPTAGKKMFKIQNVSYFRSIKFQNTLDYRNQCMLFVLKSCNSLSGNSCSSVAFRGHHHTRDIKKIYYAFYYIISCLTIFYTEICLQAKNIPVLDASVLSAL